jgi:hypothetical protein
MKTSRCDEDGSLVIAVKMRVYTTADPEEPQGLLTPATNAQGQECRCAPNFGGSG